MKHNFVHLEYPLTHPGVERAEQAVANFKRISKSFRPTRTLAAMLLAAIVAAFVVVADHRYDYQAVGSYTSQASSEHRRRRRST